MRAVAALLVVLVHASLPHIGIEDVMAPGTPQWLGFFRYTGVFGVDLFFVISGFIMLVTNWNSFAKPNSGTRFFIRRAIRIYPPYWLALVPILPVYFLARDRYMVSHVGVKMGIVQSLLLLPQQTHFILPVAWTLVWEMIFYVVFAQMLRLDRRYIVPALGVWFVVELALNVAFGHAANFYLYFLSSPLPLEFIVGALIGVLYAHRRMPLAFPLGALGVVGIVAAWIPVSSMQLNLDPQFMPRVLLFGIPAALIVYAAVALEVQGTFRAPLAFTTVGDASYAMYLWHVSLLVVIRNVIARFAPHGFVAHVVVIAATLATVVVFGLGIYRFFEKPVTSRLNRLLDARLPSRIVVPAPAVARIEGTSA